MKLAYTTLVYAGAGEPIEDGVRRIADFGYDGVELIGEPEIYSANSLRAVLQETGLECCGLCNIYTAERDLVSSNADIRRNAIAYIKKTVDFAAEVGGTSLSVTPTACMKIRPEVDLATEWSWAVDGLREAGEYAAEKGISLTIEAWNRYETYLVNRLEQSRRMADEVGLENVGCQGDLFHMNIEEDSISDAFRIAGDKLFHVHIADSNRAAPGKGHIDFAPIFDTLKDMGYDRYLSCELLPAAGDPFASLKGAKHPEFYDEYTEVSIKFLRRHID